MSAVNKIDRSDLEVGQIYVYICRDSEDQRVIGRCCESDEDELCTSFAIDCDRKEAYGGESDWEESDYVRLPNEEEKVWFTVCENEKKYMPFEIAVNYKTNLPIGTRVHDDQFGYGVIVCYNGIAKSIGVRFDKKFSQGHDLHGFLTENKGMYRGPGQLMEIETKEIGGIKTGDRVRFGSQGMGTVLDIDEDDDLGIYFDKDVGGHNLKGRCEDGYGLWINYKSVELVKNALDYSQNYIGGIDLASDNPELAVSMNIMYKDGRYMAFDDIQESSNSEDIETPNFLKKKDKKRISNDIYYVEDI